MAMDHPTESQPTLAARLKKYMAIAGAAGIVAYACALGFFDMAMHRSPEYFSTVMKHVGPVPFLIFPFETMWKQARRGRLQPGELAPDFKLERLGGSGTVQLSSFRNSRPVALVFGSYT
jgi:hypothetical protein